MSLKTHLWWLFQTEKNFKTESFVNNPNGIRKFLKKLHPGDDQCVMEATGTYSMTLLYLLDKAKVAASMINPKQSKNFTRPRSLSKNLGV